MITPRPSWRSLLTWRRALMVLAACALIAALAGCWGRLLPASPVADLPIIEPPSDLPALPAGANLADYDKRISALTGLLAQAQAERNAAKLSESEADDRAWRTWTRWLSAITITLATAVAGVSWWFGIGKLGIPLAIIAVASVLMLQAWAQFQHLLPWLFGGVIIISGLIGIVALLRRDRAVVAGAALTDVIEEGKSYVERQAAKVEAKAAQVVAGVHSKVQRARGKPVKADT